MTKDEFTMGHDIRDTITYSFGSFSVLASIAEANELLTCCAAIIAILVGATRIYDWVALKFKSSKHDRQD
jgi:hypothetical protein